MNALESAHDGLTAGLAVTEPAIKELVLGHGHVRVEPELIHAPSHRELLGVGQQRPADAGVLAFGVDGDIRDQHMVGGRLEHDEPDNSSPGHVLLRDEHLRLSGVDQSRVVVVHRARSPAYPFDVHLIGTRHDVFQDGHIAHLSRADDHPVPASVACTSSASRSL